MVERESGCVVLSILSTVSLCEKSASKLVLNTRVVLESATLYAGGVVSANPFVHVVCRAAEGTTSVEH